MPYELNTTGFFNKGGGRPFQGHSPKRKWKTSQPLGLKQRLNSAIRAKTRAEQAFVDIASRRSGFPTEFQRAVDQGLDRIQRESITVQEAEENLNRQLAAIAPTLPAEVFKTSRRMLRLGEAKTSREAVARAVAEELSLRATESSSGAKLHVGCRPGYSLPGGGTRKFAASLEGIGPVTVGGTTFAEWFGRATAGAGAFGKALNTWADWTCTDADTAIGAAIAGIWTGPAGATAVAEGATEIKNIAGCDLWQMGAKLKRQLAGEGIVVNREQAMQLITSATYLYDPDTDRFERAGTAGGFWLAIKPLVPYLGIAAVVGIVIVVT